MQSESMHLRANGNPVAAAPHAAFPEVEIQVQVQVQVQLRTLVPIGLLPQRFETQPFGNRFSRFPSTINRTSRIQELLTPSTLCEDSP